MHELLINGPHLALNVTVRHTSFFYYFYEVTFSRVYASIEAVDRVGRNSKTN